ncbi:ceruloplasmin isoform X1 [Xenopus laevis]|uniref:Ceruloplasmin n=2 Tax=Xenopus laevis TaxID=8355 RepID=A0A1L8GB09_XENLA|nr:ceruloplasmin isoform X1 [Xenopus laevis]OCT80945.1 hypothetical protein XELAEV_18027757mg [Xenopus laevis]
MKISALCLLCLLHLGYAAAEDRVYYIAIRETHWDYAPSGMNVMSGKSVEEDENAQTFLVGGPNRIGRVYKKAVYLQYTDDSYSKEIKKPEWLGFLGPMLKAEIGDIIIVHLKNFASRPYSIHPHGVQYTKENEGALYPDKASSGHQDDAIEPGQSHTYRWEAVSEQGPTASDEDCITRIYHSHVDGPKDVYSGLVGPLIICKKGSINAAEQHKYEEFILMFSVIDENLSWYLDENINAFCTDPSSVDKNDEDFQESNKMHSINGYMFGNLPGLSMCEGKHIHWYLFGMGNEVDIHSAYFHGQVLTSQTYRVDTLNLFPATMIEGHMVTKNPGKWLLTCQVNDHLAGGMQAIYEIRSCPAESQQQQSYSWRGRERHYYIAAEEVIWNYAPTDTNQFTGKKIDHPDTESAVFFEQNEVRIGGSYKKAVYVEYTDATFTTRKQRSKEEEHLGILGPVMIAQVGDFIKVTFKNNASRAYSIQAHGVSYTKNMEGAAYRTGNLIEDVPSPGSHVAPGDTFIYEWEVPSSVGSNIFDLNCLLWLYFSSVDVIRDTNSGLVGPLLICKTIDVNNQQRGIAHNYYLMATVFDENESWYLDENIEQFTGTPSKVNKEDAEFQESNMMHSINGYMYGNQPGLDMCTGDTVLWHLMGIGNEVDMHGIHFTGNTIVNHYTRADTANLFPHISYSVIMNPDNEGVFNVECMTTDHYTAGMRQHYRVKSCAKEFTSLLTRTNTYYIAAEEVQWDYSLNRTWEHERHIHHSESPGDPFLNKSEKFIGSTYKKAVYRQYTDSTFTTRKERKEEEKHLAILGPLLTAKVGEKIKIVFKNKASRPYSIYAHGVKTDGPAVQTKPGETQTYIWKIPERSGPGKHEDTDCVTWAYYSTVDPIKDTYSGLIGPLVICKSLLFPLHVFDKPKRKFALLFMIFDENESWYLEENIKTFSLHPDQVQKEDEDFIESNKMHSINGKMYANLEGLTMHVGDEISWHLIGLGNEADIHTVHFHAHSFKYVRGAMFRSDVFDLFPGTFKTVEMTAKIPGTWLLHCHVTDHIHSGMEALYTVLEKKRSQSIFTKLIKH